MIKLLLILVIFYIPKSVFACVDSTCLSENLNLPILDLSLDSESKDFEISEKTKIPVNELKKIREAAIKAKGSSYVVRVWYPDAINKRYKKYYRKSTPITLVNGAKPEAILRLPGESIVHHRRDVDGIIGKYNPFLINQDLGQYMVNKYFEALFVTKYAPDTMPETLLISDLNFEINSPLVLKKLLDKKFPRGWVLKRAYDTATTKSFLITEKTDIKAALQDFNDYKEIFYQERDRIINENPGANTDTITRLLKNFDKPGHHSNKLFRGAKPFLGFRVAMMLKKPYWTIAQEKIPQIIREYRVEVLGGKVLGSGSTVYRYQGTPTESDFDENSLLIRDEVSEIEKFVQEQFLDKIPEKLRGIPMGLDIAVVEPGIFKIIETNPGGNSGFLVHSVRGVKALDKFLLNSWKEHINANPGIIGLDKREQLQITDSLAKEFNLDLDQTHAHLRAKKARGPLICKKII